ncbi:MAG: hypothetical protein LC126_08450 [Bryobacterales bacterium]|nr:hypothetical protein [Bryobacterales bacterium]
MFRILIDEDDAAIAVSLEDDAWFEGYEEEVARDGEQAARRAREAVFDLTGLGRVGWWRALLL